MPQHKGLFCRLLVCLTLMLATTFNAAVNAEQVAISSDAFEAQLSEVVNLESEQALAALAELENRYRLTAEQKIKLYPLQARTYFSRGDFADAEERVNEYKRVAKQLDNHKHLLNSHKLAGVLAYYQANYQGAIDAYLTSVIYADKTQKLLEKANLLNNIALVYADSGETEKALEYYALAEQLYQVHGTESDIVDVRFNLANLSATLGNEKFAAESYQTLLDNHINVMDADTIAHINSNYGDVLTRIGQGQRALGHLIEALQYYKNGENTYYQASILFNIAMAHDQLGNFAERDTNLLKAKQLAAGLDNPKLNFHIALANAEINFSKGDYKQAKVAVNSALEIAGTRLTQVQMYDAYEWALPIYAMLGERENVLEAYKSRFHIKQQLNLESVNNQIEKTDKDINNQQLNKSNKALNDQLEKLQGESDLHKLQMAKAKQQQYFTLIAAIMALFLLISLYRRYVDKKSSRKLEELVAERTKELQETSEKLAHANTVKSQFLANMSHEIRTPLTAVIGHSEAMSHPQYQIQNLRHDLDVIKKNSHYLLELINDILDISRIEADRLALDKKPTNLLNLVEDISAMFRVQALQKDIQFIHQYDFDSDLGVVVDEFRLKQILLNLCSNALKFTEQGSVHFSVSETSFGVKFSVKDTGIGMDQSKLEEIFDCFTQGDNSISRRFGGSGLGLCLSEQLANLMQGSISVTSTLGVGSEFILHLEVEKLKVAAKTEALEVDVSKINGFTGKVLIAEDHPDNRELLTRILEYYGLVVDAVENGQQATEASFENVYDLILLDIQMPILDGIGALKVIRERNPSVPIVAITANAMRHEIEHYLQLGFNNHIKKPLEQKAFITTLAEFLPTSEMPIERQQIHEPSQKMGMDDLRERFVSKFDDEVEALTHAFESKDWLTLSQLAHKLCGAASLFKMHALSEAAKYLEQAAKFNDEDVIPEAFEGVLFCIKEKQTEQL